LMLKVTRIAHSDSPDTRGQDPYHHGSCPRLSGTAQTLKLEGKLLGPWVEVVRDACEAGTGDMDRIQLDLCGVTFADAAGITLLRDLLSQGVVVAACSGFVAELLHLERS